jgi:hypothetical protein
MKSHQSLKNAFHVWKHRKVVEILWSNKQLCRRQTIDNCLTQSMTTVGYLLSRMPLTFVSYTWINFTLWFILMVEGKGISWRCSLWQLKAPKFLWRMSFPSPSNWSRSISFLNTRFQILIKNWDFLKVKIWLIWPIWRKKL